MIETTIRELTEAVNRLTMTIAVFGNGPLVAETTSTPAFDPQPEPDANSAEPTADEAEPEPPAPEPEPETTDDTPPEKDLQTRCLALVRKDRKHSATIKTELSAMGAKKLGDLSDEQMVVLSALLTTLEA